MSDSFRQQLQAALGTAFTLERELGGGGMSRVLVARDHSLGRDVVVKVLAPELAEGLSIERFSREMKIAAALQEPHIVPLLTTGITAAGMPFYTMPFVQGNSLRERLMHGALPLAESLRALRDVASALAYAHARGIVHRDIKPENILLSNGTAVVTDFGIAKAVQVARSQTSDGFAPHERLTRTGISIGTPAYMAPEQAAGDPAADQRVDVYAWGVVAYELIAGHHPFGERASQQLLLAHLAETPVHLATAAPGCPDALAALVMQALEKTPSQRPDGGASLLISMDSASAQAVSKSDQAVSPATTPVHRARNMLGVAALATAVLGTAWFVVGRADATAVSGQVIAVSPFRVAGADASLGYLREGMVDLVATTLATGTLARAVDPRTLLAAWRDAGGAERDLPPTDAIRVARTVGAGQMVVGSIVGASRALTINAVIVSSGRGDTIARATVRGPADSLASLVDRLTAQLLLLRAAEGTDRLAAATSTSLEALRAYLEGRAFTRRARFTEARSRFSASLDVDSSFALAAMGLIEVSVWEDGIEQAERGRRLLAISRDRLTTRDQAKADVLGASFIANQSPRLMQGAVARYLATAPDSPDAVYEMGEWSYHFGARFGQHDARERAVAAYERVLALDPTFAQALYHLPQLYAARGDTTRLRNAVTSLAAIESTAEGLEGTRLLLALSTADSVGVRRLRSRIGAMNLQSLDVIMEVTALGVEQVPISDALLALAALRAKAPDDSWVATTAAIALQDWGRPTASRAALAQADDRNAFEVMFHRYADGDEVAAAQAAARMTAALRSALAVRVRHENAHYYLALHALSMNDTTRARARMAELRRLPIAADTVAQQSNRDGLLLHLDTELATMTRHPTLRALTTRLDSLMQHGGIGPYADMVMPLTLSRAWETLGDMTRARAALNRRYSYDPCCQLTAVRLRGQARLAMLAGDRDDAIRAWRAYVHLRAEAEPALRADLDQARATLARLERESRGR